MSVTLAPSTRVPAPLRDALAEFGRPVNGHRPVPRLMLDREGWQALARRLAATPSWALIGLWGEPARIHAALLDEADGATAVVSLDCPEGRFPSLGGVRPGAIRLERAAQDL